ncbi:MULTISPECIES: NAD-dependent epimerase/dehydratase family protein [unclassified Robiginitalea]|uniref:NAD-dependent epimerase/dehydratase family protein n=1 Tax=Robiginitalea TaxID=252306 RepID=UPI00234AFC0F|nr:MULTISPECIES: NAD-dependent epimerase/dehydratase family protein [unclassified Robiginitalea]MDC6353450.1 NAD-dependent epimerase/dehydratase family protein [Robiginitalea sp. PM2]MDC6373385.1 NAD-dependent epimerase/dehydratase family protein [Robiginitalea sp. SP8]
MAKTILILGACGQIGTELTLALRGIHGPEAVVASDIREGDSELMGSGPFEILDATDADAMEEVVVHYEVDEIYLMAAMLSATAEKFPDRAWNLNMNTLFNVLKLARENKISKIFWPSSIAVFGGTTPKEDTPQSTVMEPSTVYGISKQSGERWCAYYHRKFGVDVRSLRYPGLISWKTQPGGGTTDYAVEIFHEALKNGTYTSFLDRDTRLPMMYMDDAIRATIELMRADAEALSIRSSYNLQAMTFSPEELAEAIRREIPDFRIEYAPDFRQEIADSWPSRIDDSQAREDWGWQPEYNLQKTTATMLAELRAQAG